MSDLLFYEDAAVGLSFEAGGMVVTESHIGATPRAGDCSETNL